ncbi:MAG: stage 0 sporulation family protein [Thermodesulfobacteriota bacterium]|nr:stage 0 sporulation family protein [Thermodesulfobacteriota bacterium]
MGKTVGIRFRPQGKVYDFDVGHFVLSQGSRVIVETEKGLAFGTVVTPPRHYGELEAKAPSKKVYRLANEGDVKQHQKNLELEKTSQAYCLKCIDKLGLEMNLISVEALFDRTKLTFYYTANGRVDFRELVKMLVKAYKVRIEMRQIGVRNRAKMCGAIGRCGRELCCSSFINDFHPVSIKMAKEQGLSLNPSKISGLCGRLACCLGFEYGTYCDLKGRFPDVGKVVKTKRGRGKVIRHNILKESLTIVLEGSGETDIGLDEIIR